MFTDESEAEPRCLECFCSNEAQQTAFLVSIVSMRIRHKGKEMRYRSMYLKLMLTSFINIRK